MALEPDYTFVIYDTTTGTDTARNVIRWKHGPYDSEGLETDARPIAPDEYDTLTEGWVAVDDFPITEVPDAAPTSTLQSVSYTVNVTTATVTAVTGNATLAERQRAVLGHLMDRRKKYEWAQNLLAKTNLTSWGSVKSFLSNIDNVDTVYSTLWSTNPEAILSETGVTEPTLTEDSSTVAERIAELMSDNTLVREKLETRATYDLSQSVALGPFVGEDALTEVNFLDIGAIARGNIWAVSYSAEGRNISGANQLTVKFQYRYAPIGGALGAWTDFLSAGPSVWGLTYKPLNGEFIFGGGWDDVELRIAYNTTADAPGVNVLRNTYITAVRLTVWE